MIMVTVLCGRVLSERALRLLLIFRELHFLELLESLEIPESPQTVENKGESDPFLETLENLEIFRDS